MSNQQPVFSIEKIYVKDLSLELPNAPHCFTEKEPANVEVQVQSAATAVGEEHYEAVVTVTVTAKVAERTQFLVEASQAGIFLIRNVPQAELEGVVAVACPNILFPYVRETVSDAITRAGFPPVLLAPVNFEAVYQQRLAQQAQSAAPAQTPLQ